MILRRAPAAAAAALLLLAAAAAAAAAAAGELPLPTHSLQLGQQRQQQQEQQLGEKDNKKKNGLCQCACGSGPSTIAKASNRKLAMPSGCDKEAVNECRAIAAVDCDCGTFVNSTCMEPVPEWNQTFQIVANPKTLGGVTVESSCDVKSCCCLTGRVSMSSDGRRLKLVANTEGTCTGDELDNVDKWYSTFSHGTSYATVVALGTTFFVQLTEHGALMWPQDGERFAKCAMTMVGSETPWWVYLIVVAAGTAGGCLVCAGLLCLARRTRRAREAEYLARHGTVDSADGIGAAGGPAAGGAGGAGGVGRDYGTILDPGAGQYDSAIIRAGAGTGGLPPGTTSASAASGGGAGGAGGAGSQRYISDSEDDDGEIRPLIG